MTELERQLQRYIKSLRKEHDRLKPTADGKPGVLGRMWELQKIADELESMLADSI